MKANREQIKIIHALKGALSLDEDTYRGLVASYGADSSKDLPFERAKELIDWMTGQAVAAGTWHPRRGRQFDHLANRAPEMASPSQLRFIAALWSEVSFVPDRVGREKALRKFLGRFGVSALEFLTKVQVSKVLAALHEMKRVAGGNRGLAPETAA